MTQNGNMEIDEEYAKRAKTTEQAQRIYGMNNEVAQLTEEAFGLDWWLPGSDAEL